MTEPDFDKGQGLVPAVVQDAATGEVLMMAYMNRLAWQKTLETGIATYWSRSRNALWVKGETSGNIQKVHAVFIDCDNDTVLLKVEQAGGAACHTGYRSCFYRRISKDGEEIIGERVFNPEEVYR
ncbi:MAG: phosphoribosyl-AMP cyclohydrolase [Deltaproteobacteria bacterium HGW-Deltaproteobacteria-19]|nr:MAG: phosphoribosyl-AMP cyclohydrolase [Deltaproteobacteria bacterium HGW-Deltaproteobacteria-19]